MDDTLTKVLTALITPILTALLASILIVGRLRRERGYDRRLEWYEQSVRALHTLAYEINVLVNLHKDPKIKEEWCAESRRRVQTQEKDFAILAAEAGLYASRETTDIILKAECELDRLSNLTDGFNDPVEIGKFFHDLDKLADTLREQGKPLAAAGHHHLGLDSWRERFERYAAFLQRMTTDS